jgi:iron-sulfur cluster repair protein YtfE (RIC family)
LPVPVSPRITSGASLGAKRATRRTLFAEQAQLEDDVRRHVHLENNVLWPRLEVA